MNRIPKMFVNCCPMCGARFPREETLALFRAKQVETCGAMICESCVHVICCGPSDDGKRVETSAVPREWFLRWYPAEERQKLYDAQEERHHARGHWG